MEIEWWKCTPFLTQIELFVSAQRRVAKNRKAEIAWSIIDIDAARPRLKSIWGFVCTAIVCLRWLMLRWPRRKMYSCRQNPHLFLLAVVCRDVQLHCIILRTLPKGENNFYFLGGILYISEILDGALPQLCDAVQWWFSVIQTENIQPILL